MKILQFPSRVAGAAALLLASCSDPGPVGYPGYVEGEFLYIGAEQSGRVSGLAVSEGETLVAGDLLFTLDDEPWRARRDQAAARLAEVEDTLEDLVTGERPEEIDVLEAGLQQAQADLQLAEKELRRQQELRDTPSFREAVYDRALRDKQLAVARIAEFERRVIAAQLPAREARIAAAHDAVAAARSALEEAQWQVDRRRVAAPETVRVERILHYPGEMVRQGDPVVSLLATDRIKIRFFVPAAEIAELSLGDRVEIFCDGCPPGIEGEISFIAREVEFTPPVIYSIEAREKLVFMVEARPIDRRAELHPGLPVSVGQEQ